jgi:hypothetical protein
MALGGEMLRAKGAAFGFEHQNLRVVPKTPSFLDVAHLQEDPADPLQNFHLCHVQKQSLFLALLPSPFPSFPPFLPFHGPGEGPTDAVQTGEGVSPLVGVQVGIHKAHLNLLGGSGKGGGRREGGRD